MLDKYIKRGGLLDTLLKSIDNDEKVSVFGCGFGEKLNIIRETDKFFLFVVNNEKEGFDAERRLMEMGLNVKYVDYHPSLNSVFTNNQLISALSGVVDEKINGLIINPFLLCCPIPDVNYLKDQSISLSCGDNSSIDETKTKLIQLGFKRVDYLENDGEFAVKGDTIELIYEDKYYRLMWDWDVLAEIKECDKVTLMPLSKHSQISITGNKVFDVDFEKLSVAIRGNKKLDLSHYLQIQDCRNNMWYLPFCKNILTNICHVSDTMCVFFNDVKLTYDILEKEIAVYNDDIRNGVKDGRYLQEHTSCLLSDKITLSDSVGVVGFQHITNANRLFSPKRVFSFKCIPHIAYNKKWDLLSIDVGSKQESATQIIFAKNESNANQIASVFERKGISCNIVNSLVGVLSGVNIITKSWGASCGFLDDNVFVYSSIELCGETKRHNHSTETFEFELPKLNDIVVHNVHGVGRCLGVECLKLSDSSRDYVVIEYKEGDKLYLPVENIDSISKYVGGEKLPKLNKLGSNDFVKTKERVKANIKEMAFSLVELYKSRLNLVGYKYPKDDEMMNEFSESFEYTETIDQLNAINDIMKDMEEGKVMDRLICGDVGFGKTEVAMRAAFKTVLGGKQVAFMCPTTILSEQHFNTLFARMDKFGIKIKVLNRFRSQKECEEIFEKVKDGSIDIVVGTHKLLNKKLQFKNLGLLILDEEQKFGVEAKETIKEIRRNVNVLTLSATPIPRTLNMALSGIRDISVIETPPVSRIPTVVQVCEYNDDLLKTAILRELERNGQILIVYNRVENIYDWAGHIKKLLPDYVKIGVAHGQMDEKQLENAIFNLYNGETDVLVSTTLIENGIDLPNANTLIVLESDKLGLSQLYQLKGRIGRGDRQAYAYFTFTKEILNEDAYKRLEAISQHTAMGSGFKIALRDLEIRGAGNVLGAEQHGHMQKVGYALYVQLLNETVSELKGEKSKQLKDVRVETLLNAYIPHDYIPSYNARMSAYMKISKINNIEGLVKVLKGFEDAFGDIPIEVSNLSKISLIKNMASGLGANKVAIKRHECMIYFDNVDLMKSIVENMSNYNNVVLDIQKMPIINIKAEVDESILEKVINFLELCSN